MKSGWFNRFGVTAVLTLALVLFLLAFSSSDLTPNIRAASGEPLPSPTPNFTFPSCGSYLGIPGDKAHYSTGIHQIVGGPLLLGSDDVYSLEAGNYLQCFCSAIGSEGIQTNWLRSDDPIVGWFFEYGAQWNLGNYNYAAQNINFSCDPEDPTPTPTPDPSQTPSATPTETSRPNDGGDGLGCAVNDCSGNKVEPAVQGQVLGASTMASAGSFAENLNMIIMLVGGTLSFLGVKNLKKASN